LGRLVPNKGFDLTLRALAAIIGRFPQVRLIIGGDGPERPALEQLTAELSLEHVVDFVGWVAPEQVPMLMNAATVIVVPSRGWEALPYVALEAAMMGRPVVATRDGGLPEAVVHNKTGLIVAKEDSRALAEAISFLLEYPAAAQAMGHAARRRAQEVFSLESCINGYEALYRKLTTKVAYGNSANRGT
jgi:glycogen(starch) synthase